MTFLFITKVIKDMHLFVMIFVFLFVDIVIIVIWSAIDPLRKDKKYLNQVMFLCNAC